MKLLTIAALTSAALVATLTASAQTVTTVTFTTVDSVEVNPFLFVQGSYNIAGKIVGVPEGQPAPQTYGYLFGSSTSEVSIQHATRCERLAMLALNRPGRFNFVLTSNGGSVTVDNVVFLSSPTCKLVRR